MKTKITFLITLFTIIAQFNLQALNAYDVESYYNLFFPSPNNQLRIHFDQDPIVDNIVSFGIEVVGNPSHPANGAWNATGFNETTVQSNDLMATGFWDFVETVHFWVHVADHSFEFNAPPLPVELVSFTGKKIENSISLNWQTATEVNFDFFKVQFSRNGLGFKTLKKVQGLGMSGNYKFLHSNLTEGDYYYRLKMVDRDGSTELSPVVAITIGDGRQPYKVYPTNTKGIINVEASESVHYRIYAANGIKILEGEMQGSLDISHLSKGYYFVRIEQDYPVVIFKRK